MYRSPSTTSSSAATARPPSRSSPSFASGSSSPSRPSSAASARRPPSARGPLASYARDHLFDDDDDLDDLAGPTPQPSSSRYFATVAHDDGHLVSRRSPPSRPPRPVAADSPPHPGHDIFLRRPPSMSSSTSSSSRRARPPPIVTASAPDRTFLRPRHPTRRDEPSSSSSSSSDDERQRPLSALMPRSALANYFNLDFSFLDDEPPPRKSAYGRHAQEDARRAERSARGPRSSDDYFTTKRLSESLPASKRLSTSSTASGLPFPSASLPFPSRRPTLPHRPSNDSVSTRRSSLLSPSLSPNYSPSHLPSVDGRRPSAVSYTSVESAGSNACAMAYASRRSPLSPTFPAIAEAGPDAAEKRKRLAAFLDETASAMEGGRSLMMVVPELQPAGLQHKSLSDLAEQHVSPQTSSRTQGFSHPFSDHGSSPSRHASPNRQTSSPSADSEAVSPTSGAPAVLVDPPSSADQNLGHETGYAPTSAASKHETSAEASAESARGSSHSLGISSPGLGLSSMDVQAPSHIQHVQCSPSTVRASSPVSSAADSPPQPKSPSASVEADQRVKRLEKRRKIIRELVETETSYAVDMAVVRDIYLARARGAHMAQIADHVMSTGLGLGNGSSASPPSPTLGSRRSPRRPDFVRRISDRAEIESARRASSGSFGAAKGDQRRPPVVPSLPTLMPGQPLMSEQDLHVVFANLEEIAGFADGFANALDAAAGTDDPEADDDRIGEIFVDMIPRIQQIYSIYCVRHHRAILRLQELEPTLRTYLSEAKTLSHGRTNAWDLASLLIKPVQRCLKYPLLLDQILAVTPETHPDRVALQRANADMLLVAEHINEVKKKQDAVNRVVGKDKSNQRRESSRSISSSVTKKLLRSSQKAKTAFGFPDNGGDEMFDTLVALVDSTRSGVLRFSNEMRDWTKSTKAALEAQVNMVEGWIQMYAPMAGERHSAASVSHRRLCIFLDEVLIPIIELPWRELDYEVRRSLILKTDHLLSLFESPRQVIAKRNDKMLDHSRYLAKKLPVDRRGSEEFLLLSSQLLEELPRFLGSVSRYFNIIVGHFAGAQAAYHEAVQERWNAFAEQWVVQVHGDTYEDIEASFMEQHEPLDQMMETLAAGLGLAVAHSSSSSPQARQHVSRHSHRTSTSSRPSSAGYSSSLPVTPDDSRDGQRESYMSGTSSYSSDRRPRTSLGSGHRSSVTSDSSAPSLRPASAGGSGSSREVLTPPPLQPIRSNSTKRSSSGPSSPHNVVHEPLGGHDRRTMAKRYDHPLPSPPPPPARKVSSTSTIGRQEPAPRLRSETSGRSAKELRDKYLSTYSVYLPSGEGYGGDGDDESFGNGDAPLYIAEAVNPSRSTAYRSGYPILSFDVGERFYVELEEADRVEGGSGWLLGRKLEGENSLGWARTEDFVMVEEEVDEEEASP
ncbi:hypothetical protein JCM8208_007010 [Rhodotorula glutinis]